MSRLLGILRSCVGRVSPAPNSRFDELNKILGAIRDVVWSLSPTDLRALYVTLSIVQLLGLSPEKIYGLGETLWDVVVDPADRDRTRASLLGTFAPNAADEIDFRIL